MEKVQQRSTLKNPPNLRFWRYRLYRLALRERFAACSSRLILDAMRPVAKVIASGRIY
jgi:hypothetical protein